MKYSRDVVLNGKEIQITRVMGLFEWSQAMMNAKEINIPREVVEYWISSEDGSWVNKETGMIVSSEKEICTTDSLEGLQS